MAGDHHLRKAGQVVNTSKDIAPAPKVASLTKGKWKPSAVTCGQLDRLSIARYLPAPEIAFTRLGLTSVNNVAVAETIPRPAENERVCFVPFLIHKLGFPLHPFLRGLLHFYCLQFHHLSPNSILILCVLSRSVRPSYSLHAAGHTPVCGASFFESSSRPMSARCVSAAAPS